MPQTRLLLLLMMMILQCSFLLITNIHQPITITCTIYTVISSPTFDVSNLAIDNSVIQWTNRFKYVGVDCDSGAELSVNVSPITRKSYVTCNRLNGLAC